MAVTFDQVGALATETFITTLNVVVPSGLDTGDILIITVLARDNQVHTLPSVETDGISAWANFVEVDNTTGLRTTLAWARVTDGTNASGNTVAITKPSDNNTLFAGVASSWKGCVTSGSPIDGTTPTTSPNASSDTVTYATFDPTGTDVHVIAIGTYANDLTTAGTISGTNPTLTNRFDLETAAGGDGSIFCYSGDTSDGAATGARSHSTTSTADAVNIGILFALTPSVVTTSIKTVKGLDIATVKTMKGLAKATVKTKKGLT